jgi:hypothetical protein
MTYEFERAGIPNMLCWVDDNVDGLCSLIEGIDLSRESVTYHGQTSWRRLGRVSNEEIGEWLAENGYYAAAHGQRIAINPKNWKSAAVAVAEFDRQYIGQTIDKSTGRVSPVFWNEFRKELTPEKIANAREELAVLMKNPINDRALRSIFELFGKLGYLI